MQRIVVVAILILGVLAAGAAAAWFARAPVAGWAIEQAGAWRGAPVTVRVEQIDPERLVLRDVVVGAPGRPAIVADRVEAVFGFPDVLGGSVRALRADGLVVRVIVTEAGAHLPGVDLGTDAPAASDGAAAASAPEIEARDAQLIVETPAGEFVIDGSVAGGGARGWDARARATLTPAEDGAVRMALEDARAEVTWSAEAARVRARLAVSDVASSSMSAEGLQAEVSFDGAPAAVGVANGVANGVTGAGTASVRLDGVAIAPDLVASATAALDAQLAAVGADAAAAHLEALAAALADGAGSGVDGTLAIEAQAAERALTLHLAGPAVLAAQTGARVELAPTGAEMGRARLDAAARTVEIEGLILRLGGGAVPDARVLLETASAAITPDGLIGEASGAVALAPFAAAGVSVGADLGRLEGRVAPDGWSARVAGRIDLDGGREGWRADAAAVRLDVDLVGDDDRLRLTTPGPAAVVATAARVAWGEVGIADALVRVEPLGELYLFERDGDVQRGAAQVSDLLARVDVGEQSWRIAAPTLDFTHDSNDVDAPFKVRAQAAQVDGRLPDGGPVSVRARVIEANGAWSDAGVGRVRFEGGQLDGEGLPVRVAEIVGEADLAAARDGVVEGRITLVGAQVRDAEASPRFGPLQLSGAAEVVGDRVEGELDVALASGAPLARGGFSHDLSTARGEIEMTAPRLSFAPRGLQPTDLAPILRGFVASARGAVGAEARARWAPDEVAASGAVTIEELDFDTAVGRVEGLRATLRFADLVNGVSEGPQELRVGLFNPGVPLENGRVTFALVGDWGVQVDAAEFPFAGGRLTLEPGTWSFDAAAPTATFGVENIDLREVLDLVRPPDLEVTGRVSGRAPVAARERSVFVEGAVLSSVADGRIAYTGAAGEAAASADPAAGIAFDALRNFEYDELELEVNGDLAGMMFVTLRAQGRNPDLQGGTPIEFELNTNGELARLIQSGLDSLDVGAIARQHQRENAADEPGEEP